ncbi:MAG: ArnT family glycosyltransferase [Chthoniobacterales bacterium]
MASGTRTFGLDETFLEPQVLAPPPTRHALLVFLLALASILHFGSAGWSHIHNGPEGYYAGGAREMLHARTWHPREREPPLVHWLIAISYRAFGVSAAAARMPIAGAMVASIALTFLIGERLAGYWRGFAAGLLHLCCVGPFIWGRIVTPEPIFAALIAASIFCAVCGYQRAQTRRLWFAGVWICVALACLVKGAVGLLYPAAVFLVLALLYREARLRFRRLLHWHYLLLFLALVLPLYAWSPWPWFAMPSGSSSSGAGLGRFLLAHTIAWFPALLLVLPGLLFATRRILRPHEFDFAAALPLCWLAVGFLPLFIFPERREYGSISMWSAFALWSASVWDRTPRVLRLAGIGLVTIAGIGITASPALGLDRIPASAESGLGSMAVFVGSATVLACLAAAYFVWTHRQKLALAILMLGIVPIGLAAAEVIARRDPYFSLAGAADFLQSRLGQEGEVLYEGSANAGSSLRFYLDRRPVFVSDHAQVPSAANSYIDSAAAIEKMTAAHPVYLIIQKDRVPFWQERLTRRFHIYHQVTTCGSHVVLNNSP